MKHFWLFIGIVLLLNTGQAHAAEGPSFDCQKASGTVEQMICKDSKLAILDREIAKVYADALAKTGPGQKHLKTEQRGWVRKRNDCSKASDTRQCVEDSYAERIVELQVIYSSVPSLGPFYFQCNDSSNITAFFFQGDPPSARFTWGKQQVVALLRRSGSGSRYEGQNVSFWDKGKEAMVTWKGREMTCRTN